VKAVLVKAVLVKAVLVETMPVETLRKTFRSLCQVASFR